MVKEMLVTVKEGDDGIDSSRANAEEEQAEASEQRAGASVEAAEAGEEEIQAENATPGGGDEADKSEEDEDDEFEKGKKDKQYETYFPKTHDIREKARHRTHEALMKRWGYSKKND